MFLQTTFLCSLLADTTMNVVTLVFAKSALTLLVSLVLVCIWFWGCFWTCAHTLIFFMCFVYMPRMEICFFILSWNNLLKRVNLLTHNAQSVKISFCLCAIYCYVGTWFCQLIQFCAILYVEFWVTIINICLLVNVKDFYLDMILFTIMNMG